MMVVMVMAAVMAARAATRYEFVGGVMGALHGHCKHAFHVLTCSSPT
jgi:hypothetical protein